MVPNKEKNEIVVKKEVININQKEKNEFEETYEEKTDKKNIMLNDMINEKEKEQNSKINANQVEMHNELLQASESKQDNNYKDLDITKMEKILTLKTKIHYIRYIFVLNDGRFIISKSNGSFVFDLKKGINFQFPIDLTHPYDECPYSYYMVQMNDGKLLYTSEKGIKLIDIKENEIETTNFFSIEVENIFKLSEQKILMFDNKQKYLYVYENGKLIKVNKKKLKVIEKLYYPPSIYLINENEIAIFHRVTRLFNESECLGFFDLEKNKSIQSFNFIGNCNHLCLINENLLIYVDEKKNYPIHLKNHSKKKPFIFEIMDISAQYFL